jgi:uroporphyrinogen decarboxylase
METRLRNVLESAGDMVDIVFFADDLGSQTGLLMSIETYENLLKPFHMRLTETVRAYAPQARTMLHSDGAVFDILPSLIDAGFDVLEAVQTDATGMDPGRLKETYGSRLSFHGAISVQQLLPNADVGTVKNECRRLVDILGAGGGYIAAPSHAIQTGTPPENVMAMLEAVLGDEDYQNACEAAVVKR